MNIILKVFLTVLVFNFLCFNKVQAREVVTGSGCAISKDYVLTANHVVDNAERIVVSFGNATAMKATVVKKDVVEDWAVLKLDGKAPSYVICSSREVSLGEKIYTLGFPSSRIVGEDIKYADGVISSLSGMRGRDNSFQFTVPIQPGSSGGPLFNEDGQVIGIVQSSINPEKFFKATDGALPQNMNFGGRIKTLRSLLGNMIIFDDKKVKMEKNQEATCLIKASIIKQTPNRIRNKEMNRSAHNKSESIQKESKHEVSSRYTQLENCLKDIAYDGIFRIPDGDVVDVRTDEGFQKLDDALHLTYDSMCLEVDKNAIVKEKKVVHEMVQLNRPFDYKLKNETYTYTNTYTVSKDWYKANAQYLTLQARDTMAQVYNKANISNDRVIDFFNLKVGDVLSVKKFLFWEILYINGSIAKNLRFDSVLSFSAKDKERRNVIFDSISYKLYDLCLKKPVLGMKYLRVVTDGNNSILGVIAHGNMYIDVNAIAIIRVIEMKTGKKFSFLDNRADDKVEAFLKRHGYDYFSWSGIGESEDFSDACPSVIRESVSTEDTNIYIVSESFDGDDMLWIGDPNFYEILQESERKEREKRVKESLYIKIENVDGL